MSATFFHIKNMVCNRCVTAVEQAFGQSGLEPLSVKLGEVKVKNSDITSQKLSALDGRLIALGFERIDDRKSRLLEQIKTLVIETIHHEEHFELTINWSHFLAEKLNQDYHYLSSLFSSVTGITLEQYIIRQKIEKVKEFLFYDELSVKEIAYKLGYSNVAHLSAQFKKVTGLTPTDFKANRGSAGRQSIDGV